MSRAALYLQIEEQLQGLLVGVPTFTAAMASTAALLHQTFDHFFWTGFYLPAEDGSLTVGPYQGPLACLVLPAGRGVCSRVAATLETVVVPDVAAFEGHISCDARAESEIVVPIVRDGELLAVLDVDSDEPNAFGEDDRDGLESVAMALALATIL